MLTASQLTIVAARGEAPPQFRRRKTRHIRLRTITSLLERVGNRRVRLLKSIRESLRQRVRRRVLESIPTKEIPPQAPPPSKPIRLGRRPIHPKCGRG